MLTKSKKGAVIMAGIFVLSAGFTSLVINAARYSLQREAIPAGMDFQAFIVLMLLTQIVFGLIVVALSFFFASTLDDSHYGYQGALRWAIMGLIYASIYQAGLSFLLHLDRGTYMLLEVTSLGVAYLLAFKTFLPKDA